MESLGAILKRLQQQNTFDGTDSAAEALAVEPESTEPPCPLCGGLGWVRRDVPIGDPHFGKAVQCFCQQQVSGDERLARLQRFSNMGKLAEVSFEKTDPDGRSGNTDGRTRFKMSMQAAQAYAEDPQGWLVLEGGSGTGKTHLAAAIANRCMEREVPVLFVVAPDLLDHLRASFGPQNEMPYDELFEQIKSIPMLVLDDLGVQSSTPWAEEKLFQLLNHRYVTQLSTVITTNVAVDQTEARLQSRLSDSRLSQVLDLGDVTRGKVPAIGGIPTELLTRMTFATFEPQGKAKDREGQETLAAALQSARSFAQEPDGWLVFMGDTGCGKTHLAVAVAEQRIKAGQPVFFALVPDLLDYLRYTFSPDSRVTYDERFEEVKQTPLLILDDLGAESSTQWANEKLYQIIVHRHNAQLPTIITTRQLPSSSRDPIASRINDPRLVTVVPITAPDFRQHARSAPAGRGRGQDAGARDR